MLDSFAPSLPPSAGYGITIGIGFSFALLMILLTKLQNRYTTNSTKSLAEFTSASGNVRAGLVGAGIVSAWTWSATLLVSSSITYKYGISGAWWYGAGATVQVLLFSQNAIKLKMNAPKAATFLQVIRTRWGRTAHLTFLFFSLATNVIVSSMLITGGSDTVNALTGMPVVAACFLIPLGVVAYVLVGGMRATLLCDYTHTAVLYAIILAFMGVAFGSSNLIGSPKRMHELLVLAAERAPVIGNAEGSYLTLSSKSGAIFGVINLVGNFATVFNDQAYWQRAIASEASSCVPAFLLGGSAWLAVPFGFATTMGLTAVALGISLSPAEVGSGLPAPAAAQALLGSTGAAVMLVLLFLAVTSATSAELVAVSSVVTYDIYLPYMNPGARDEQMLRVDHIAIVITGFAMAILGTVFYYAGISMGWLYEFMGVILGAAVIPIAMSIMSTRANKWGCVAGAWIGMGCGIMTWLVMTSSIYGELTIESTFNDYPMMSGNIASLGVGGIISVVSSLIWPENFDFDITRTTAGVRASTISALEPEPTTPTEEKDEKKTISTAVLPVDTELPYDINTDPIVLQKSYSLAVRSSVIALFILIILIPLPLYFSKHIYSVGDFTIWIAAAFIWVVYGTCAVVIYPIYESREAIGRISGAIIRECFGGGIGKKESVIA